MGLSEKTPEDKKSMKNGVIGFVLILIIGQAAPMLITEMTGVDINAGCIDIPNDELDECIDAIKNSDIKSGIQEGMNMMRYALGIIAFVVICIVVVKY